MFTPRPHTILIEHSGLDMGLFLQKLKEVMQVLFFVLVAGVNAQQTEKEPQLKMISNELVVKGSVEEVWDAIASFGNAGSFLSTIDESYPLNGSKVIAAEGAERESMVPDGMNNIIFKERIIDILEGSHYTYEVYDSENFTLKKMIVTFGVTSDRQGRTILYSRMRYQMNSALMTHFLRRKLNKINFNSLIGFKYYVETGEKNTDIKSLRKRYYKEEQGIADQELIADNGIAQ